MTLAPWQQRLARLGGWQRQQQRLLRCLQWSLLVLYGGLLLLPPLMAAWGLPGAGALAHFARWLFWCVWWPVVLFSVLLFGQFWCGVFCPDGALTEFASRHGRGGKLPARVRWPAWPLLLFLAFTLGELLGGTRASAEKMVLVQGGLSLAALVTGLCLGRGKRVWCRYLCPAAGLFSLLARCALLHFRVDRPAWDRAPRPLQALDCPLMLDVRRMRGNEKCSMCGRCSHHREAVALALRWPGDELTQWPIQTSPLSWLECTGVLLGLLTALPLLTQRTSPSLAEWGGALAWSGGLLAMLILAAGGRPDRLRWLIGLLLPLGGMACVGWAMTQGLWDAGLAGEILGLNGGLAVLGLIWSGSLIFRASLSGSNRVLLWLALIWAGLPLISSAPVMAGIISAVKIF